MISVSASYKTAINKPDRVLKSRITMGNVVLEDDVITTIAQDGGIVSGNDFEIGTAIMATTDIELTDRDYSLNYNFEDQEIEVEIAVKLSDNSFEYVSLGLFTIEESNKNDRKITLNGSDRMHKFEKDYVSTLSYPATLLQIAQDICSKAGVALLNTSFPNSTYAVNSKPVLDGVTCRKAIAQIAELAGGYARITRDGKLEMFNLHTSIKNTENYASADGFIMSTGFSLSDELIAGEIEVNRDNYINLTNKDLALATIDKVIVKLGSEQASKGAGTNLYYIIDNIFCQNPNSVIDELYNALNDLSYMPFNAKWQGNPAIDCGDMITINTGLGRFNTIATSKKLTYKGGLREEYKAVGKSNTEKNSTSKGSLTLDMQKAKTEIKVLDGKIEQRVTQDEFESYVVQTAQEISSKVSSSDFQSYQTQTAELISSKVTSDDVTSIIEQSADEIRIAINNQHYSFTENSFTIGNTTAGDSTEHTPSYSKYTHTDGSYTKISADGMERFISGQSKKYHYLMKAGEGTTYPNSDRFATIQLPDEFKGKNFEIAVSVQRTIPNTVTDVIMYFECSLYSKDIANGRFTVYGGCWIAPTNNINGAYSEGWLDFSYVAIA